MRPVLLPLILLLSLLRGHPAPAATGITDHAVIFTYHHVSDTAPQSTRISPATFESQLAYLAKHNYRIWPLTRVVKHLRQGEALPDSVVVLTFDDGYRSVHAEVFPRMQARGWPFTVFVVPQDITHSRGPVLTWEQLREMKEAGVTIATHGFAHDHLQRLQPEETLPQWTQRLKAELAESRAILVKELGDAPDLLAYPYGEYGSELLDLVADLGWWGFGQQSGAAGPLSDTALIPRYPMADEFADPAEFALKCASLPLPVARIAPRDPRLSHPPAAGAAPVLEIELAAGDIDLQQIRAYASGQGAIGVTILSTEPPVVRITAPKPLRPGRSRYNMTVPYGATGRWSWYSHTWIVGEGHDN